VQTLKNQLTASQIKLTNNAGVVQNTFDIALRGCPIHCNENKMRAYRKKPHLVNEIFEKQLALQ
jgi:hypothetical protein